MSAALRGSYTTADADLCPFDPKVNIVCCEVHPPVKIEMQNAYELEKTLTSRDCNLNTT